MDKEVLKQVVEEYIRLIIVFFFVMVVFSLILLFLYPVVALASYIFSDPLHIITITK